MRAPWPRCSSGHQGQSVRARVRAVPRPAAVSACVETASWQECTATARCGACRNVYSRLRRSFGCSLRRRPRPCCGDCLSVHACALGGRGGGGRDGGVGRGDWVGRLAHRVAKSSGTTSWCRHVSWCHDSSRACVDSGALVLVCRDGRVHILQSLRVLESRPTVHIHSTGRTRGGMLITERKDVLCMYTRVSVGLYLRIVLRSTL